MKVGLIGAGNIASALARGWGGPVLCTDHGSGRAQALADELGGEAAPSNAELAQRADLVVLAHKPAQLEEVAREAAPHARQVVSLLAGVTLAQLRAAYPGVPVFRIEPNTPVELGRGVLLLAVDDELPEREAIAELFGALGTVVEVPESRFAPAAAVSGVGPAYLALIAEAWVDAAVRHGLAPALAAELVAATMTGTGGLLEAHDTLSIRRAVASPGGATARGLAALEREGVRAALHAAMDAVIGG